MRQIIAIAAIVALSGCVRSMEHVASLPITDSATAHRRKVIGDSYDKARACFMQ